MIIFCCVLCGALIVQDDDRRKGRTSPLLHVHQFESKLKPSPAHQYSSLTPFFYLFYTSIRPIDLVLCPRSRKISPVVSCALPVDISVWNRHFYLLVSSDIMADSERSSEIKAAVSQIHHSALSISDPMSRPLGQVDPTGDGR